MAELSPRRVERYGWQPDIPDHRDLAYTRQLTHLPPKADLRDRWQWTPFDQGALGSCTANAISAGLNFIEQKDARKVPAPPSRLYIYYNERLIEGTVESDSGAQIRDGLKVVNHLGYYDETVWPYDVSKFTDPPPGLSNDPEHVTSYHRIKVQSNVMKDCLAHGYPIVVGFTVYESFEQHPDGNIPMPKPNEAVLGGHAVLLMGYDDGPRRWLLLNSWGPDWGDHGYFTLPYGFLDNPTYGGDYWTIRREDV